MKKLTTITLTVLVALMLSIGTAATSTPLYGAAQGTTVADQISDYYANDGVKFLRSSAPMDLPVTPEGSISHVENSDGTVTLNMADVSEYADIGFGINAGRLGDLNGILVQSVGDEIGLNLYFDVDADDEYFDWTGDQYTGTGNDKYILGQGSTGGVLEVTGDTLFESLIPGGGNYTLAQLKAGNAPGINADTNIRIWVGLSGEGTKTTTVETISISSGPIQTVYVDDDYSAGNADGHIFGVDAFATIKGGVDAVAPGGTVIVAPGTYATTSAADSATINKPGITIQGAGSDQTFITTGGSVGYVFSVKANDVTLTGLSIEKTDHSNQGIIYLQADGFTLTNSVIFGHYEHDTGEVSRAMVVSYGSENMTISGNTFHHLRQPGYFNGSLASPTTGNVSDNFTYHTKGWVIDGANFDFTDNTWGTAAEANVFDIAILAATSAGYYPDIVAISEANHDAVIEDQRVSPAVLSIASVDVASAYSPGDGGRLHPYNTIQAGVDRVVTGGKVLVAPGTYVETVKITTPHRLLGSAGAVIKPDNTTLAYDGARRPAIYIDGADGVTIDTFEIDGTGGDVHMGVYGLNSDGSTVRNLDVHDIQNDAADVAGVGILFFGWGQGHSGITIEDNTVANTGRMGIWVGGMQDSGDYKFLPAEDIVIRRNLVQKAWQGPTEDGGGAIQINGAVGSLIAENEVGQTGNGQYGIYLSGSGGDPTEITGNEVFDNPSGIGVWTSAPVVEFGSIPVVAALVHGNSLHGNNVYGVRNVDTDPAYTLDATLNWWDSHLGPTHVANPVGDGQEAKGNVTFQPWLCSGTDADPSRIGFQPASDQGCTAQDPTALVFTTQPVGALFTHPLATQPVVTAVDDGGNLAVGFSGEVTLALQGGAPGATLSGEKAVEAVEGVAPFSGLSVNKPGTGYRLVATSDTLTVTSDPFDMLAFVLYLPQIFR